MKNEERIEKVNQILQNIRQLEDEDIEAVREMAEQQANYAHPLKTKTAGEYQQKGNRNLRIVDSLESLYNALNEDI